MAEHENKQGGRHVAPSSLSLREQRQREKEAQRRRAEAARAAEEEHKAAEKAEKEALRRKKAARARARRRRAWRTVKIVLLVVLIVAAVAAAGLTYAAYRVTNSTTNLPGVSIRGIDVGKLTKAQTLEKLSAEGWDKEAARELTVTLPGEVSFTLKALDAGVVQVKEDAAKAAFAYGHGEGWFDNLYCWLRSALYGVDLGGAQLSPDRDYISAEVKKGLAAFAKFNVAEDGGYTIDRENDRLLIVKGLGDIELDEEKLNAAVTKALQDGESTLDYTHADNELPMPDFEAIHKALAVEPEDAHWIDDTFEVEPEIVGCKFDVAAAQKLWEQAGMLDTVAIPLEITEPEVTKASLESMLYRDCLGSQTSLYTSSSDNRINNINLAVSRIDGVILMPGDVFSYNGTVGQRTTEAGFLEAGAYTDGQVVQEIGGGICQVSSTLYCATLYAQLGIVQRESHYFRVTYLPWGMDATVSWPKPDFKFQNTSEYPIKIVASCDNENRELKIEIWGTNTENTTVEITSDRYYITDATYTSTIIGWNVYTFAHVYDADGNLVREYELPASTYFMHDEDIQWPPEKFAPSAEGGGDSEAVIVP